MPRTYDNEETGIEKEHVQNAYHSRDIVIVITCVVVDSECRSKSTSNNGLFKRWYKVDFLNKVSQCNISLTLVKSKSICTLCVQLIQLKEGC